MQVLSPKQKLVSDSAVVKQWHQIVDSSFFIEMSEKALMDYIESVGDMNESTAIANYYRIQGARLFRKRLLTFADPPEPRRTPRSDMLEPEP